MNENKNRDTIINTDKRAQKPRYNKPALLKTTKNYNASERKEAYLTQKRDIANIGISNQKLSEKRKKLSFS